MRLDGFNDTEAPPPAYKEKTAPDTKAPGGTPRESLPINVLIVGETQNGKSTLIRQMGIYAGIPEINVRIGFGNVSCTKTVGLYEVSSTLRKYHLEDHEGREIKGRPYSELLDLTDDDAKIVAENPEKNGRTFKYTFVDTPGLDDSDGNDMEIMANIVGRVGELDHLNAMIYLRNMNRPFGSSFTRFFDYIQRSMPTLCNGLIIVHSGFAVEKVEEFLSRKKDLAKLRQEAFKAATKSNLDLSHFFMDNDPDQTSPFAMMQSLNECFRLLNLLALQKPLPTSGLKLLKTPSMYNVDVHIQFALQTVQAKVKNAWEAEIASATKARAQILKIKREIQRLDSQLAKYHGQLSELNARYSINLGTRTISEEYSFVKTFLLRGDLWVGDRLVEFDADTPITNVEKSATGGCEWKNESLRDTYWRGVLSANIFRSINGSATFYTTSEKRYAREIEMLKVSIVDTERAKEFHEEALMEAEGDGVGMGGIDKRADQLGNNIERLESLIDKVKKDTFDIHLWPLLKRFYVSDRAPSKDDVVEFVKAYDTKTAELL